MSDAKVRFFNEDMEATDSPAEAWFFGYACPKEKDIRIDGLAVRRADQAVDHPSWQWNGDMRSPTFHPSIDSKGACNWHGYVRKGRCVTVDDQDEPEPT